MRRRVCIALLSGVVAGCVGSEPANRVARGGEVAEEVEGGPAVFSVGRDTVSPVAYHVFDRNPVGTSDDRAVFRVLVLGPATSDEMAKTLRLALDSLGRAESRLVAARAVLYTVRPGSAMNAELIPRVWGEWVPPEGWGAASAAARKRPYRTYIYLGDPGWSGTTKAADEKP